MASFIVKRMAAITTITFMMIVTTAVLLLGLFNVSTANVVYGQSTTTRTNEDDIFTAQKTAVSKAGTLPIHQTHQTVKVLPARDDGKVWVGTISWASSKPVELELWHSYNSSIGADTEHGQPIIAPYGNGTIAFTLHEGRYFEIYHRPPLQLS